MVSPLGVRDTEPDEGNSWDRLYLLSRAVERARASGDDEQEALDGADRVLQEVGAMPERRRRVG